MSGCDFIISIKILSTEFFTDEMRLSTLRPAVSTSNRPLCKSSLPYRPNPMAAQHSTVTTLSVTLRLVIECAVLGFRSQHLVIKYRSRPKREMMRRAAGTEPKIPRL